jgi:hypothetical protein
MFQNAAEVFTAAVTCDLGLEKDDEAPPHSARLEAAVNFGRLLGRVGAGHPQGHSALFH